MSTIYSKKMTLNNLSSDITAKIREKVVKQPILSIPIDNFLNENYIGAVGATDSMFDIDKRVESVDKSGSQKLKGKGLLHSLTFGMWKNRNDVKESKGVLNNVSLRIGECPVINPPWQFNELDDARSNLTYPHMGRVYLTYIYSNYPIIVFQPGREKMNANVLSFFTKGLGRDHKVLNEYIREGGKPGFLGGLRVGLISIKNTTLAALEGALGLMGLNFADMSKFITFKPAMKLYRELTNNLLREFAANLGLLDLTSDKSGTSFMYDTIKSSRDIYSKDDEDFKKALKEARESGDIENEDGIFGDQKEDSTDYKNEQDKGIGNLKETIGDYADFVVDSLDDFGTKVDGKMKVAGSTYRGTTPRLDVLNFLPQAELKAGDGPISRFVGDYENKAYLPYMCQSNITISESFSNSTKEHPVVSEINALSEEAAANKNFGAAGKAISAMKDAISGNRSFADFANGIVVSAVNKITGEMTSNVSEMGMILNGDGKMLIPEIYGSSSYSRSYNVDFDFWSPVGDIVSIFENAYIPYLLLFPLSVPLQTGYNTYISPFVIKVFSKGLFSVDMGMVENLSVTKSDGQNDRTIKNFPRTIKVSMSIKDLSPVMMLSLGNGAFWKYKRANSSLTEYIATMCNLSISDRFDIGRKFDKYWALMTASVRDKFSLTNIGYNLSGSFIFAPARFWNRNRISVDRVNVRDIYY